MLFMPLSTRPTCGAGSPCLLCPSALETHPLCRPAPACAPLQMELGGKDAAIVCADADIELAAKHIVKGAFSYSGQRCTGACVTGCPAGFAATSMLRRQPPGAARAPACPAHFLAYSLPRPSTKPAARCPHSLFPCSREGGACGGVCGRPASAPGGGWRAEDDRGHVSVQFGSSSGAVQGEKGM